MFGKKELQEASVYKEWVNPDNVILVYEDNNWNIIVVEKNEIAGKGSYSFYRFFKRNGDIEVNLEHGGINGDEAIGTFANIISK